MARAQDLLDQAIALIEGASRKLDDTALAGRAGAAATELKAQRDKFFFKSLVGVPLANKARAAAETVAGGPSAASIQALESVVVEIRGKADAPGTVLT